LPIREHGEFKCSWNFGSKKKMCEKYQNINTPETATIVPSAPEDGRKKRPKHVEQFCSRQETYC